MFGVIEVMAIISLLIWSIAVFCQIVIPEMQRREFCFGAYPCCDMINKAIKYILDGKNDKAVEELLQAIWKADGYIKDDIAEDVNKIHDKLWSEKIES